MCEGKATRSIGQIVMIGQIVGLKTCSGNSVEQTQQQLKMERERE